MNVNPIIVERALSVLFGEGSRHISTASLGNLDNAILKTAFRQRSMHFHPDRSRQLQISEEVLDSQFKRLHGAYRLLNRLNNNDESLRIDMATQSSVKTEKTGRHPYYRGSMPQMPLRFAQYLYYAGIINWDTLIDALIWQTRVRPKIGDIGREYQFLDHENIIDIIKNGGRNELFGDTAIRMGLLNRFKLNVLVGKQHNMNLPIGRYFVEKNVLSRGQVRVLVERVKIHNRGNQRT